MRTPLALVGAVGMVSIAVAVSSVTPASADPLGLPLPSVSVTPLPTTPGKVLPTPTLPVPTTPSVPRLPTLPPVPGHPVPGGPPPPVPHPGVPGGGTGGGSRPAGGGDDRGAGGATVKPMIAGTPGAAAVVDDETTAAMLKASKAFLGADEAIAAINAQQKALDAALATARRDFAAYPPLAIDADNAQTDALRTQDRYVLVSRALANYVNIRYRNGNLSSGDAARTLADSVRRLDDTVARAEIRLGMIDSRLDQVRAEYAAAAQVYARTYQALANAKARLAALAAKRSAALAAIRAAKPGDLAQNASRLVESGHLGAQIRSLSAKLRAEGRTVQGSGHFIRPGHGPITSPFGMRYHPILHYTKLHTGTDFGHADNVIQAADDGVVIMTVTNRAYGNMTVIDHGTIGGRHITTMYAHQARFLVKEGQRVKKGDVIGVIGATGYATGPHLHFEVRDDGAVEDPAPWLPGNGS